MSRIKQIKPKYVGRPSLVEGEKSIRTAVTLPENVVDWIQAVADRRGEKRAQVIREILEAEMTKTKRA